jgi:hypothetical protein
MSGMEVFYGVYEKSDLILTDEDDARYVLEQKHGCYFVDVDGQLYSFYALDKVNPREFGLVIEPSDQHRFICYFHNGGGEIHAVVADLIRTQVTK